MDVQFFNNNEKLYKKILQDIGEAKSFVYLETFSFGKNKIGHQFREALENCAKEEVDVRLLLDGFGSSTNRKYFKKLSQLGGQIKFYKKFKISFNIIHDNNYRNHRKLLVIDDKISYIGSVNITDRSINWRDATLRLSGTISTTFRDVFLDNFKIADKHIFIKKPHTTSIKLKDIEIFRDIPSIKFQKIRNEQIRLIKNAKKQIIIETPYFLPGRKMRIHLKKAVKRGVKAIIILPKKSDMKIVDILREKYFGKLYKYGVSIIFYTPKILHSKLMLIDNEIFSIGSANMDPRSTLFHFELNLFGTNKEIIKHIQQHLKESMSHSENFNYEKWKKRSIIQRIMERLLSLIKYLL